MPWRKEKEVHLAENIKDIKDDTFEDEVIKSDIPVLLDFWAEWCGPCTMIVPALENIAQDFQGRIKVAKVNVDENMKISSRYGVMSIPTLLLFKGGEVKETLVGALPQDKIIDSISKHL